MKLLCRFVERRLALFAVCGNDPSKDERLASHLRTCASCSRAWDELQGLHEELRCGVPAVEASPDLVRTVTEQIQSRPASMRPDLRVLGTGLAIAAGVGVAALGLLLWSDGAGHTAIVPTDKAGTEMASKQGHAPTTFQAVPVARSVSAKGGKTAVQAGRRRRKRARPVPPVFPRIGKTLLASGPAKKPAPKVTWEDLGLYFESAGDYRRASAAYALAYRQEPAPALAYATARSAESAGDIDRALDYYAAVLDAGPNQKQ